MDTIQRAQQVLRDAEASLRGLMEEGLKQQRYSEIAEMAGLADGVAKLLSKQSPSPRSSKPTAAPAKPAAKPAARPSAAKPMQANLPPPQKKGAYPRFERDGDRLVKVGWSKKNKKAYEHRAPREAVIAFARHLASRVDPGQVFAMEDLFPVPDVVTGDEVPAYQAYLTLAWLREAKAIEKKGRDGYVLRMNSLSDGGLDQLWDHLPERTI